MKSIVITHPFGNPNSYNAALAFYETSMLSQFHTCLFAPFGTSYRAHPEINHASIRTHPLPEIVRLALTFSPFAFLNGRQQHFVDWVTASFDKTVARAFDRTSGMVYCYEDAALATFRAAESRGMFKIYDLPTGYYEESMQVCQAEVEADKSLAPFFKSLREPPIKLKKKRAEIAMADHIVCASTFTRTSILKHVKTANVSVVPYGVDTQIKVKEWRKEDCAGPLQVIFVGGLQPRKGLHYLFRALQNLPPNSFELTLAGRWVAGFREWVTARYRIHFRETGHVDRRTLYSLYRRSHILVFPSLFDGFGLVLLEAMACGIPAIATERTGGPDIISDGKEGYVFRAGSSESLVGALTKLLDNRSVLAEMGEAARRRAESLSWAAYRAKLVSVICSACDRTLNGTVS